MNRVTLTDLNNIQQPTNITQNLNLKDLFICDENVYAINQDFPQILMKYRIKDFALQDSIKIVQLKLSENQQAEYQIKSLNETKNIIAFSIQALTSKNDELSCKLFYINQNKQIRQLTSHMASINQIINFKNDYLISCSNDLTIRVWKTSLQEVFPNPKKHALSFHKDVVTCLEKYQNCLISGSKDNAIAFWSNFQLFCSGNLKQKVIKIQQCPESQQIAVFTQNNESKVQIKTISMVSVLKKKICEISRIIRLDQIIFDWKHNDIISSQIDESFLVFSKTSKVKNKDKTRLVFVQINLGKQMTIYPKQKIKQEQVGSIQNQECEQCEQYQSEICNDMLDIKCLGRLILFGSKSQDIQLIRI